MKDPLIGLVGKPSSGKSTTLNALTDASAKVGAFPFTTIDPNKATGYVRLDCACARFGKQNECKPNYGWCDNGVRYVPVVLLDVAGLVPGAHEGRGLGNKFLDDLRQADALIHVVDVSGSTDAEGKATKNYDPLYDIEWLQDEIFRWIRGNLTKNWGSIARRHAATKSATADTLSNQFSGYGATRELVARSLWRSEKENNGPLAALDQWDDETIDLVVRNFTAEKFPTVLALNKCDHSDSDGNIARIARKYSSAPHVLTSAMSEVLLRKLAKQNYVKYEIGTEFVDTKQDLPESDLKDIDESLMERLDTVRDLVLYRFGSTGVAEVLRQAVKILDLVPVYTVKNMHNFGGKVAFPDCLLVRKGTTIGQIARKIMGDVPILFVEGVQGRLAEDDTVDYNRNDILSFKVGR